jgi:hypothetical protein
MVNSVIREFFFYFLDWLWEIKSDYIKLPKTKEDIAHVEELFRHVGYPVCLGGIDCVHVPWLKCNVQLDTSNTVQEQVKRVPDGSL